MAHSQILACHGSADQATASAHLPPRGDIDHGSFDPLAFRSLHQIKVHNPPDSAAVFFAQLQLQVPDHYLVPQPRHKVPAIGWVWIRRRHLCLRHFRRRGIARKAGAGFIHFKHVAAVREFILPPAAAPINVATFAAAPGLWPPEKRWDRRRVPGGIREPPDADASAVEARGQG
jgi:hypothetical protein